MIYNSEKNDWIEYSIQLMQNNKAMKKKFMNILQALGTGIQEIHLSDQSKSKADANAKVVYDRFEVDLMTEESAGIKRLFQMICPMLDILDTGKVLICDELENSLHESVIFQVVQMFQTYAGYGSVSKRPGVVYTIKPGTCNGFVFFSGDQKCEEDGKFRKGICIWKIRCDTYA